MWQTVDYKGNTVKWYEAELIELVSEIAKDIIENDCYENSDVKAQKILDLIEEYSWNENVFM